MAPLRSSRSTRHADHANANRARIGVLDLDPTDGLPVQKWSQVAVRINQDASLDSANLNSKSTNSADWNAQFGTPQFPWQEPELPTFYKELPTWNQEMIRRARTGNTTTRLSVWDRKNACWMSAAEAEKRSTPLKSLHLNNLDERDEKGANEDAESAKSDQDDDDEDENKSEDEEMADDDAAPFKTSALSSKRRKLAGSHLEPREFEVKRWTQVPVSVAEKAVEPKFLADRRPGMPPLYTGEYTASIFGQYASSIVTGLGTSYDLGDGGGLGNANGVLGGGEAPPAPTPPRRNIPPKRKKKKLGGPGRRKANPNPTPTLEVSEGGPVQSADNAQATGTEADGGDSKMGDATSAGGDTPAGKARTDGGDVSDESEAEGSEEGEIDEGGHLQHKEENPDQNNPPVPEPPTALEEVSQLPSQEPVTDEPVISTAEQDVPMIEDAVPVSEPKAEDMPEPEKTTADQEIEKITEQEAKAQPETAKEESPKPAPVEPDFLGGLDAAIDKNMSEEK